MLFLHKGHYTTNVVSSYARFNVFGGLVEKVFVESGRNIKRRLVSVSEGLSAFFEEYYGSLHGVKDRNFPLHYLAIVTLVVSIIAAIIIFSIFSSNPINTLLEITLGLVISVAIYTRENYDEF